MRSMFEGDCRAEMCGGVEVRGSGKDIKNAVCVGDALPKQGTLGSLG